MPEALTNERVDNLRRYWDIEPEDVVRCYELTPYETVIELRNGNVIIFDDTRKGVRLMVKDISKITEIEWRRMFGYRLRILIRAKNMTLAEFAEKIGTYQTAVSCYINGLTMPGLYTVHKMAQVLECTIDELTAI